MSGASPFGASGAGNGGHRSGGLSGGAVFSFWIRKFRPDAFPSFLAQHLSPDFTTRLVFKTTRLGGIHIPTPSQALIQVLLVYANQFGDFPAALWGDLFAHGRHLSDSLATSQAVR